MGKKSTNAAMEQRISEIFKLLIRCIPRQQIHQYASSKWGANSRSTDELIRRARKLMVERYLNEDRDQAWSEEMATRDDLYGKAFQEGKYAVCLEIARDRSKLRRLYQKDVAALDALAVLSNEGLATPEQMKVVVDGINSIQEKLRSLSKASE